MLRLEARQRIIVTGLVMALAVGLVFVGLDAQRSAARAQSSEAAADVVLTRLENDLLHMIEHAALVHGDSTAVASRRSWADLRDLYKGTVFIGFASDVGTSQNLLTSAQEWSAGPQVLQALSAAKAPPSDMYASVTSFVPNPDNPASGTLVGVIRNEQAPDESQQIVFAFEFDSWLSDAFALWDGRGIESQYDVHLSAEAPDLAGDAATTGSLSSRDILGHRLTLELRPITSGWSGIQSVSPELITTLLAGMSIMLLLALDQRWLAIRAEALSRDLAERQSAVNADLSREVKQRREAELKAHKARAATEAFLATMSHEVRTPLNAIMGMFELIQRADDIPPRVGRQAKIGHMAAKRLFQELSNVIDTNRLDNEVLTAQPRRLVLPDLIEVWSDHLRALTAQSDTPVKPRFEIDPNLPRIAVMDGLRVTQIVYNLLDNAVKFTAKGHITLQVARNPRSPNTLDIRVRDTGCGVTTKHASQIFQRFYQVDHGANHVKNGAGLGLSICREIADLMKSELRLEYTSRGDNSAEGGESGSVFYLKLFDVLTTQKITLDHVQSDNRSAMNGLRSQ